MINGVSINSMTIDGFSNTDKIWASLLPTAPTKTRAGHVALRPPVFRVDDEEITNAINILQIGIKFKMSNISTVRSIDRKQHRPVVVISSIDHKPKVTVKIDETKP
jgi:hypothetical protein